MRVMVVEDEAIARRVVVSIIKGFRTKYEVVEACCGEDAIEHARKKAFDIVITDIEMREKNGIQLIEEIKKISSETKFLIVTGYSNFEYAQKGIKLNVVDYILKPIDPNEVCKTIKTIEDMVEKKSKVKDYNNIENKSEEVTDILEDKQENNPLEKILNYINKNYKEDISLDIISEMFYFNASYLSILFKKTVGCNFLSYLTRLRMEEAKRLAEETSMKINEICKDIGYKDYKYFCVIFKKHYGMTPNELRRSNIKIDRKDKKYDNRPHKMV